MSDEINTNAEQTRGVTAAEPEKPQGETAPVKEPAKEERPQGVTAPAREERPHVEGRRYEGGQRPQGDYGRRPRHDGEGHDRGEGGRFPRFKRKGCRFCREGETIDYKKMNTLERFVTDGGKILPRRVTGTCAKHQRVVARAIKRARIIALLPFIEK